MAKQAAGPAAKTAIRAVKKATVPVGPRAGKADGEAAVLPSALNKIVAMPEPFHAMGERIHAVILRNAPALRPALCYGMPGYAKDAMPFCFSARIALRLRAQGRGPINHNVNKGEDNA